MNVPLGLRRSLAAARGAGAELVEGYHRRSRTRLLLLGPSGVELAGERTEDGTALRVWMGGAPGFAAGSAGEDPVRLARLAVAAAGASGRQAAGTGAAGEAPETSPVSLFDPELLRLTPPEMRRRLAPFLEAAGVARRPGLPWSPRAFLRVAVVDSLLVRPDGKIRAWRTTLAAVQVRLPSAFGLARLEGVCRRLADLEPASLVPLLAAYPVPGPDRPAWLQVQMDPPGDDDLLLASPVVAVLAAGLARRAAAAGRAVTWESPALLRDDPLLEWGPGSIPWDGEGNGALRHRLAGPGSDRGRSPQREGRLARVDGPDVAAGTTEEAAAFCSQRLSYREPPRPSPSNLVLSGVPAGPRTAAPRRLHLLEVAVAGAGSILARGVLRRAGADDRPVLARLRAGLEDVMVAATRAGAAPPLLLPAGGYLSVPALLVPGVRITPA